MESPQSLILSCLFHKTKSPLFVCLFVYFFAFRKQWLRVCILFVSFLKNLQPSLCMNNSFLSNQSILCLVSTEKLRLRLNIFLSSSIAFSIILNMFTVIREFQQGLATGNCCNSNEYKFVGVDFILGIMSLLSCWQEFVASVTLGIPSSETYYISHFDVWDTHRRHCLDFLNYSFPFKLIYFLKSSL